MTSLEAEVARLQAEAAGKPFAYSGADPSWLLQAAIHAHRIGRIRRKDRQFPHKGRRTQRRDFARRVRCRRVIRERLGVAQNIGANAQATRGGQAGSKLQALVATDIAREMARALANAEQTGEGAKRDQEAVDAERDAYIQGWRADVSQKLVEANGKVEQCPRAAEQGKAASPAGRVAQRPRRHRAVGGQGVGGLGACNRASSSSRWCRPMRRLRSRPISSGRDNGFVHVGDPVVIKFDTFPYSQYGMAEGTVRIVSPDSFTAQEEARNPTSSAAPVAQRLPSLSIARESLSSAWRCTTYRRASMSCPACR